ncbi:MAG: 3'-5' exonuclease [Actinobacteria bacterium]|nr:3'-5' exonuclease [Actinomycetota bacterium]
MKTPRGSTRSRRRSNAPVASAGFAVLDVETTGLSPARGARTIEIGLVLVDLDGTPRSRWETLIDPGCGVGPTHIHGVTDAMVQGAPAFGDIVGDLADQLEGRTIVAHNAEFDIGFLDAEFAAVGIPWDRHPLCTMRLARRRGHHPANLAYLCDHFGIVNHGAHRALDDAVATAELLACLQVKPAEMPAAVGFPSGHPGASGMCRTRADS